MNQKLQVLHTASEKFIRVFNKLQELEKAKFDMDAGKPLTPAEIHTIVAIAKNIGFNVTELSNYMGITKGAVSQMLNKLEIRGLIRRKTRDDNAKEIIVYLTKKGHKAYDAHEKFHYGLYMDFIQSFTIEELAIIEKMTDKMEFFIEGYLKKRQE